MVKIIHDKKVYVFSEINKKVWICVSRSGVKEITSYRIEELKFKINESLSLIKIPKVVVK